MSGYSDTVRSLLLTMTLFADSQGCYLAGLYLCLPFHNPPLPPSSANVINGSPRRGYARSHPLTEMKILAGD